MIGIIVQARMSSTRLPKKVLKEILSKPMLHRQVDRLKNSKCAQKLIIATSDQNSDLAISQLCSQIGVECFLGPLDDVLARFYKCAKKYSLQHIVRISGDCPLIDAAIIDEIIEFHLNNNADYTTNCIERTFPDGQDIEIFTIKALKIAYLDAKKPSEREHVTPYIRESGQFSTVNYLAKKDLSHFRMSVDHKEDFDLVTQVYKALYPIKPLFSLNDIVKFLDENPTIYKLNQHISLNEGYTKSLAIDKSLGYE